MKKQITIILFIFLISNVLSLHAGESYSFKTNLTNPFYTVAGNSSDLEGLNVDFENGNITISTDILMSPDSFTLIFFDNITTTNTVTQTIYTGGGGSSSSRIQYVDRNITKNIPIYETKETIKEVEVEVEKIVEKEVLIKRSLTEKILSVVFLIAILFITYLFARRIGKRDINH